MDIFVRVEVNGEKFFDLLREEELNTCEMIHAMADLLADALGWDDIKALWMLEKEAPQLITYVPKMVAKQLKSADWGFMAVSERLGKEVEVSLTTEAD